MSTDAKWWHLETDSSGEDLVYCDLCPTSCKLGAGATGACGTRANLAGKMVTINYGKLVSAAVDPIEKKPLYHFYPGSSILSVAAAGCNLHCKFCQNWNISQKTDVPVSDSSAAQVIDVAKQNHSIGIAYTYSEPLVWYEFVSDTARLARQSGLQNVLVTNGYLNPEPLDDLLPFIDAANIDLKSMDDDFYQNVCQARLDPVLDSIIAFKEAGVHLELTNLLIPGYNDSEDQINRLVDFVADLDPNIPLHFSAYHPSWQMSAPGTSAHTLRVALQQAEKKLRWVYLGNARVEEGRDTICPDCQQPVIIRAGRGTQVMLAANGRCPKCECSLPIISG